MMSVPRPAMFVAMVTEFLRPAWATISASRLWCLALSTSCLMPRRLSIAAEPFALFDRHGADQDRPPAAVQGYDLVAGQRLSLLAIFRLELDAVVLVFRDRTDQLRTILQLDYVPLVHALDFLDDGLVLFPLAAIDDVGKVRAA